MARKSRTSPIWSNAYMVGAVCLFVLAVALMVIAVQRGEAHAGIFLAFPYITGGGIFLGLAILLVFVGIILLTMGSISQFVSMTRWEGFDEEEGPRPRQKGKKKPVKTIGDEEVEPPFRLKGGMPGGGVVFIGPVPIVFGPNAKITKLMLYLAIVLVIGVCLLFFALSFRGI